MKSFNISLISLAFLLVFWGSSCGSGNGQQSNTSELPYYNDPSFTPHWLMPGEEDLVGFHQIAPFQLINQNGDTITEKDVANKIYITDFFFTTCPGICPKMTENMALLQEAFSDDDEVLLLSHSVTPERDSVSVLKKYATAKGVKDHKWHLLTGALQQIYDLGRNSYFVEEDLGLEKEADDFLHTENFVLIDQQRHIRGIYNGLNLTAINQLIADVKTIQKKN